jgi:ATP-binding cassette subfamily D (ALD) long-chain fatty acid import protein
MYRKLFPSSPVVSVQVAGRHLYLILDSKLASQIYRKPNLFVFNPFNILVWRVIGATKEDQKIARIGAQLVEDNPTPPGDTRRVLHDSHMMAVNYLSGEPLGEITRRFVEALCEDIDRRFPSTTEWETLDICDYVKTTWTHASTIALFGSNFWSLWPDAGPWLWDFDASFQKIVTQMPRLLFPKPYAIRDEGLKRFVQWEEEARKAEVEGKIEGSDNDDRFWDPFWGHIYARKNMKLMAEAGVSPVCRAGLNIGLFWGVSSLKD